VKRDLKNLTIFFLNLNIFIECLELFEKVLPLLEQVEGSLYLAKRQLYSSQRSGGPIMDGAVRRFGDQAIRRRQSQG